MNSEFFQGNRKNLTHGLGSGVFAASAYTKLQGIGDMAHPFKQESNFWYLTGIQSPDWQLIIDLIQGKSWLIAPDVDTSHQLFDGSLTPEVAKAISGVDEVIDQKEADLLLQNLAKTHTICFTLGIPPYAEQADFVLNPAPERLRRQHEKLFNQVIDCQQELTKLRAIKQSYEISIIEKAANTSVIAFEKAKKELALCRYEYEIDAEIGYCFRRHKASHAFEPIVANGKNACTLHYVDNSRGLQPGSLLLIDAGARLESYSADITRTFAVGEVTKRQGEVHEAVQIAESRIIDLIKPGFLIKEYIGASDTIMKEALLSLGLLKHKNDTVAYRRYFPHAISHGLGLDVHESLGGYKEFQPGMVLTVEPGIYIPEESVGVRIEDDILVTTDGNKNLTAALSTDL